MPMFQVINSFGLTRTISGGVKGFSPISKTSINRLKALIGVVSRLNRALTFLRKSLLISTQFRVYLVAKNYIRPVQSIHFTMLTYTFNGSRNSQLTVEGEIRKKKTQRNRSTRLNNKLAPKIRNFFTNISQTSIVALVPTNKSEHSNITSNLVYNKDCSVPLDTILFILSMNKIEDKRLSKLVSLC